MRATTVSSSIDARRVGTVSTMKTTRAARARRPSAWGGEGVEKVRDGRRRRRRDVAMRAGEAPVGGKTYRLVMLRHSASSWADANSRDAERPLTAEGRDLAKKTATNVRSAGWLPDFTICSNSARSKETLEMMREVDGSFGAEASTLYLGSLYHFASLDGQLRQHLSECVVQEVTRTTTATNESSSEEILSADDECGVGMLSADARTIMCVGHNKGMEEAAGEFCGRDVRLQVATAALLEKTYEGDDGWVGAMGGNEGKGSWRLVAVASPEGILDL
jgi:phosphohistidine phosphatase SixA